MKILTINAGSSSMKFSIIELPEEKELINGYFQRIGLDNSFYDVKINGEKLHRDLELPNHLVALECIKKEIVELGVVNSLDEIDGIGHRLVHGGEKYKSSVLIDDEVIATCNKFKKLAKLHMPAMLACIEASKEAFPNTKMVAVFDTAFHQTMPKRNYIYPVPLSWYEKYSVRKYGFHGTSHKYITEVMKQELGRDNINIIVCHVGSGASIAAIKDGKCYDTTMGLTPLDGLMMGTRCGAIDPSILEYVCKEANITVEEATNILNKQSGFLGVAGASDCRDVESLISEGNEDAKLAYSMYCDRIAKYIVDYYIELEGKVDAIIFTAGVGENGSGVRKEVLNRLNPLGIYLDAEMNDKIASFKDVHEGVISTQDSKVEVRVLPTDEEIMIVRDTYNLTK